MIPPPPSRPNEAACITNNLAAVCFVHGNSELQILSRLCLHFFAAECYVQVKFRSFKTVPLCTNKFCSCFVYNISSCCEAKILQLCAKENFLVVFRNEYLVRPQGEYLRHPGDVYLLIVHPKMST
jgi:hypothetical protein